MGKVEKVLFFRVSDDKYELPIGVCTRSEIEKVHRKKAQNVASMCAKYNTLGIGKYRSVNCSDEGEDDGKEEAGFSDVQRMEASDSESE